MNVYDTIRELGLELPKAPNPIGLYKPVNRCGNLLYISGQGCMVNGKPAYTGRVGAERTVEEGIQAARICGLNALSVLEQTLGDLNKVKKLVKTLGFVACTPDFGEQPKVINGASQLMKDIWGEENGIGARSAVGVSALPAGMTCEVEFVFEMCD